MLVALCRRWPVVRCSYIAASTEYWSLCSTNQRTLPANSSRLLAGAASGEQPTGGQQPQSDIPSVHTAKPRLPHDVGLSEFAELERRLGGGAAVPPVLSNRAPSRASITMKPEPPAASECCGTGCDDCVWVEYWRALTEWEEHKMKQQQAEQRAKPA
jgi:Oxidoreductase-like protein, N-terminal